MQAVFIRHKLASSPDILEDLWANRLIAVHYANIASTEPGDYEQAGRRALTRLWRYCESGAVVGATYRAIRPAEMMVGELRPGSEIKLKHYGDLIYKTVHLENVTEAPYRDYPLLAAIQPRGGTVTGWPSAQDYLEAVLTGDRVPWCVDSLAPGQLEVLCYEFMRMKGTLSCLVLPIGRGLPDVDIFGLNDTDETVLAQVTHDQTRRTIDRKLKKLKAHQSAGVGLVFFGPRSCHVKDAALQYVAIEDVFDALTSTENEPRYRAMISRMLGWT
jgi:hypothetical protein